MEAWRLLVICATIFGVCATLIFVAYTMAGGGAQDDGRRTGARNTEIISLETIQDPVATDAAYYRDRKARERERERDPGAAGAAGVASVAATKPDEATSTHRDGRPHDPHIVTTKSYAGTFRMARQRTEQVTYPTGSGLPGTLGGGEVISLTITCRDAKTDAEIRLFPGDGGLTLTFERDQTDQGLYLMIAASSLPLESNLCKIFYAVAGGEA
jgi:hypothetical protein